ncbi:hypothetical protein D3C80_2185750 [compost metagenome]
MLNGSSRVTRLSVTPGLRCTKLGSKGASQRVPMVGKMASVNVPVPGLALMRSVELPMSRSDWRISAA